MTQGEPGVWRWFRSGWRRGLLTLCVGLPGAVAAACPGPALHFVPLAPGVWWVPAADGESDAGNRGQVSNLLLVREAGRGAGRGGAAPAPRLWALGSGPSPAFGRALACQARQRLGLAITDAVSPWARPELVLGVAGLGPGVRHWAHAVVADAMAEQCAHCIARLRQRLGPAAGDLGAPDDPVHLPGHRLQGDAGRLGPLRWWRLPRAEGRWLTVWRLHDRPLWFAPGLLGHGRAGPPDGRDATLTLLQQGAERLQALAAADGAAARLLGEQGPPMPVGDLVAQADYWRQLLANAATAIQRGDDETAAAPAWPGLPPHWAEHAWHGFNWQRAWRQVEAQVLATPAGR